MVPQGLQHSIYHKMAEELKGEPIVHFLVSAMCQMLCTDAMSQHQMAIQRHTLDAQKISRLDVRLTSDHLKT